METPLYSVHVDLNAKIAPFGDWDMPIQYSGIIAEHLHTRKFAGVFDICHMGEFRVKGHDALSDLEKLNSADLAGLKTGRCKYGFLLNENGGVIDDFITYKLADDEFMLVVNSATTAGDYDWIKSHLSPTTIIEDISEQTGKIDLQGPMAYDILNKIIEDDLAQLKYFAFINTSIDNCRVILSRTGYTGELGYEIYCSADDARKLWGIFLESEKALPAGLGARDTLRLEAGLPLYGHELGASRTPIAAGLSFAVNTKKEFIGKNAVMKDIETGCSDKLAGLKLDGRQSCRQGQEILLKDKVIGKITSGSFAPSLGFSIAFAYIKTEFTDEGTKMEINTGRKMLPAEVCSTPFYKKGTAKIPLC